MSLSLPYGCCVLRLPLLRPVFFTRLMTRKRGKKRNRGRRRHRRSQEATAWRRLQSTHAKYQRVPPVLDEFITGWPGILRRWRAERDISCSRHDLQHFVGVVDGWFGNP